MKIAIDAMGGDNGHQVNVAGACLAINEFPILEKGNYGLSSSI